MPFKHLIQKCFGPYLWLDANEANSTHWPDKSDTKRVVTVNGSPSIISSGINGMLFVVRYSGSDGEYHNFGNISTHPNHFLGMEKFRWLLFYAAMITDTTWAGKVICLIIPMHRQMSEMVIYD